MKKRDLKKKSNAKTIKAGSYSLAVCAVALAAVVIVNLLVAALPARFTEKDISASGLYTIGDYSRKITEAIDTDVKIYHLATKANIDDTLTSLLTRYSEINDHIEVEVCDPELTQIASKYTDEQVSENSLIFVSDKRSKVVDVAEIYEYSSQMQQYAYYGYEVYPDVFDGESEITSALDFVTTDTLPVVYYLTGHNEYSMITAVEKEIMAQNIALNELDLMLQKTVPDDCECLIILSPSVDITEKEFEAIVEYLNNGGRVFLTTLINEEGVTTPNFDLLLEELGLETEEGMIIEGDQNAYYYSPNYLIPTVVNHDITDPIRDGGFRVLLPVTQSIKPLDSYRSSLTVKSLFTTTDKAFRRTDLTNTSIEQSDGDIGGVFNLGYAVSETIGDKEMKAVVLSTPFFLDENFVAFSGNLNLLLNSLKWMCNLEEKISVVDAKSLSAEGNLEVSSSSGLIITAVIVIVIPLIMLVTGVVIFVRRKKR
ncbi:MAG: Gldg family protein [Clostridia bacterium]|nr:Gldg family protein [Clostridia bacterium]